jgi:hypothetical protein
MELSSVQLPVICSCNRVREYIKSTFHTDRKAPEQKTNALKNRQIKRQSAPGTGWQTAADFGQYPEGAVI